MTALDAPVIGCVIFTIVVIIVLQILINKGIIK